MSPTLFRVFGIPPVGLFRRDLWIPALKLPSPSVPIVTWHLCWKSAGPQGGGQGPIQRAGQVYKINNKQAALRGGAPDFKSLGKYIPKGTAVEILEEQSTDKDTFVRVKNVDSGAELGWTKKENVTGIQEHYKAAKASYTYHIGGYDLLVYVPKGIETTTNPNIFLFFHGNGGDYSLDKKHTPGTYEFPDNPALSSNMNDAVANSGSIAICPQGKNVPSMSNEWGGITLGRPLDMRKVQ